MPNGITTVNNSTFAGCTGITEVEISASVNTICKSAFAMCTNLQCVYFYGDVPSQWDVDIFSGIDQTQLILYYPEGNTSGWTSPAWTAPDQDGNTYNTATFVPEPGFNITGQITSYNPANATTIQLKQNGEVKYTTTIASEEGSGQVAQNFTFLYVEAATYDMVISKEGHLTYTITGIVVADGDIDLTKSEKDYSDIVMIAGDMNGDGYVNSDDLNEVWNAGNYNKSVGQAANSITDIDGDGYVNANDLNIVWNAVNYNKSAQKHCIFAY